MLETALLVVHIVWKLTAQITYNRLLTSIHSVTALQKIPITQTAQLPAAPHHTTFMDGFDLSASLDYLTMDSAIGAFIPETN